MGSNVFLIVIILKILLIYIFIIFKYLILFIICSIIDIFGLIILWISQNLIKYIKNLNQTHELLMANSELLSLAMKFMIHSFKLLLS